MNIKLQIIFSIILILNLYGNLEAQTKVFSEAKGTQSPINKIYDFEKWNFSIGKNNYEINKKGHGKLIKEDKVYNFQISIEDANYIDRVVYFAEYKRDILLMGELNFDNAGGGFIICLDDKTLRTKWRTLIPVFNISKGLIEGNSAYLAGIGFISKINLNNGKYIWKHNGLYRKYDKSGAFNVFLPPQIKDNSVIFKEDDSLNRNFNHQIQANKLDGKIIKVILN